MAHIYKISVSDHYQFDPPSDWPESAGPASAKMIAAFKLSENLAFICEENKMNINH